ncbi:MAG TPA: hypothetical protein DCS93_06240 [Microscillaceae bacterium]|nr:hypothetical protein [Microscillaceae bacterium]
MKSLHQFKKQVLSNSEKKNIRGGESFQECGSMVYYHKNTRWKFQGCYRVVFSATGQAIYQGMTQHGIMDLHCPPKYDFTAE